VIATKPLARRDRLGTRFTGADPGLATASSPFVVDLFCGLGGWSKVFIARGARVIGVDLVAQPKYPSGAEFLQADCLTLDGAQFRGAALVVASSPCDQFSPFAMPWTRKRNPPYPADGIALFRAAERIAREAGAPLVLENVRAAQAFVGRAVTHVGPFYLWGDGIPALIPASVIRKKKESYGSKQRAERAEIPAGLATAIARFY
jgi:hypothetical protein